MRVDILKPLREVLGDLLKGGRCSAEQRCDTAAGVIETLNDMIGECLARLMQMRIDVTQTLVEGFCERAVGACQGLVNRRAGLLKPSDDLLAVRSKCAEQVFTDARDRKANLFRSRTEGGRDAIPGIVEVFGETNRCGIEFLCEGILRAAHGGTHPLAVGHHRFTFGLQFIDERTNAALVFRIGALEVGHFGTNKGLQFPSACQRPLDAVAPSRRSRGVWLATASPSDRWRSSPAPKAARRSQPSSAR
ncbi:MAG: hypothetical protein WDN29_01110 [Methylovirgula sp.]